MPVHLDFTTIILNVVFSSLSCSHTIESFLHPSVIYRSNPRNFKNDNNKAFLPFRTPIAQANYAPHVSGLLGMEQSLLVRIPGRLELLNFWWSKSNSIPCCPPHSNSPDFVVLNWHFSLHFDWGLPQNTCPKYEPKPQTLLAANFTFLHCDLIRPLHSQYWLSLLIQGPYLSNRRRRCQLSCQR